MQADHSREELKEIFDDQVESMIILIDEQINNLSRKYPGEQIVSNALSTTWQARRLKGRVHFLVLLDNVGGPWIF
jgi:hypothetical protein